MEPLGSDVCRRPTSGDIDLTSGEEPIRSRAVRVLAWNGLDPEELRTGAGAGAAVLALSSSGEVVLLGVLLGVAAGELLAGMVAMLAVGSVAIRWGTTSVDAITGAQTVLGPAAAVGPLAAAASTWCAAAALILVRARGITALVFGLTAGIIAVGPAGAPETVAIRVVAAAVGAALALTAQRWAPPPSRTVALALGAGAVALAVMV